MKHWWCGLVLVAAAAGCKRREPVEPADDRAAVQALWKLAPDRAQLGVVISPRAIVMAGHAWGDLMKVWDSIPEAAVSMPAIRKKLLDAFGTTEFSPEVIGWSSQKGLAAFTTLDGKTFMVFPVGDEAKWKPFLAKIEEPLTCQTTHGVYACSEDPAVFARIGTGSLNADFAGAPGDIEIAMVDIPSGPQNKINIAVAAALSPGGWTTRGAISNLPPYIVDALGAVSTPRIDGDKTTGFMLAHVKQALASLTGNPLAASIDDPITMTSTSTGLDLRVPLSDPGPAQQLVDHCTDGPLVAFGAKLVAGTCEFAMSPQLELGARIDGSTLRVQGRNPTSPAVVALSPLATELSTGKWAMVLYARGSLAGISPQTLGTASFEPQKEVMGLTRVLSLVSELGIGIKPEGRTLRFVFGVRTIFANPPAVVDKLLALDWDAIVAGKGPAMVQAIADGAPGTPLAEDVKAGASGIAVPAFVAGFLYRTSQQR